jgi:hypothetical protein
MIPAGEDRRLLWGLALLTAAVVCLATFYAKGGLTIETMTSTEIALTCLAGAAAAGAILLGGGARRAYGLWPLGLLLAFAALTAVSVVWSVQPDESWQDAGRMFAYCAVFGAAIALVRLSPSHWPALLGGLALAAVVVCGYALLTKVFPGGIAAINPYARLEEPFGYWNAIGLTAAMGVICCMWLGSRRSGHALLSALAYPATGLLLLTLMLAYSRGALAALLVGLLLWFVLVPLRLRGAAVLILSALCAGGVAAWDFATHALSAEGVALADRAAAGHRLGALVLAMIILLGIAGLAIGFLTGRRAPSARVRRNAGTLLLAAIACMVLALGGALAHSHRGLTGSISHAVDSLTNPNAKLPANTPGRLTAVASVRARYWKEALQVFEAHPALGTGGLGYHTARLRYRRETIDVQHAHGFIVQTLADLGLAGLAVALALLLAWMAAAGRATHPLNRSWSGWRQLTAGRLPRWRSSPQRYTPERIGLLSMLCVVVVFGVHSLVDWTWYVPGDAIVALLCAGWLAGRGPLEGLRAGAAPTRVQLGEQGSARGPRAAGRPRLPSLGELGPVRVGLAGAVILGTLLAVWAQWQPLRSIDASQEALALVSRDPRGALAAAQTGVDRDPLSAEALFTLAGVQRATGQPAVAQATLQRAVRLQPSNPATWLVLGKYELTTNQPAALKDLEAGIYLDPEAIAPELIAKGTTHAVEIQNAYIQALRVSAQPASAPQTPKAKASTPRSASAPRAQAGAAALRAARRRRAAQAVQNGNLRAAP